MLHTTLLYVFSLNAFHVLASEAKNASYKTGIKEDGGVKKNKNHSAWRYKWIRI